MLNVVLVGIYILIFSSKYVASHTHHRHQLNAFINSDSNVQLPSKHAIGGKFLKQLFKKVRRTIKIHREMPWEREERLRKVEQSQRDGLIPNPKTSYDTYLLYQPHPLSKLKARLRYIKNKLQEVGGEDITALYCGLRKLTKPIRQCDEAILICFSYTVFPSLYWPIRNRFVKEDYCLRVLTIKDQKKNRSRRLYRKDIYPQTLFRHPYNKNGIFLENSGIITTEDNNEEKQSEDDEGVDTSIDVDSIGEDDIQLI